MDYADSDSPALSQELQPPERTLRPPARAIFAPAAATTLDAQHQARDLTVAVVGLGYVGLPTAIAFAESGCAVVGYDTSEERLTAIKAAAVDILPADHARLSRHLGSTSFTLTTNPAMLASADAVMICVPTPIDLYLVPDLSALTAACQTATRYAAPGQVIILTSTTYVGCTRRLVVKPLTARGMRIGENIFVAFSPERLDPGNATPSHELIPRVIGGVTEECRRRAVEVLVRITTLPHTVSSPESAEMTKLLENTFRAVNIALANEFADVCGELHLDIVEIIEAAATKPYGYMPFYPGPGVGGHCIPCDPHYLLWQLRARRARLPVTETAMMSIAIRPRYIVARVRDILGESGHRVSGARVLLTGVSYKPGIADLRASPALEIMTELRDAGATVAYFDPHVPSVRLADQELTSVPRPNPSHYDIAVVHTLHPDVDYGWLAQFPVVLDATYRAAHLPSRVLP
ncbi:MAG TPA: nucleotide sugar dehydrogenase [Pseudonocardiaceae bacterium]|jgi:nucleotide sugar dehydrogenase|nr:nucleotide sugar dehydrogenase [Pseudonocardiaceae bacterium]